MPLRPVIVAVGLSTLLLLGAGCNALPSESTDQKAVEPAPSDALEHFYYGFSFGAEAEGNLGRHSIEFDYPTEWSDPSVTSADYTRNPQRIFNQPTGGPIVPQGKSLGVSLQFGGVGPYGERDTFSLALSSKDFNLQGEGYLPEYYGGLDIDAICAGRDASDAGIEFLSCVETMSGPVLIGSWKGWSATFLVAVGNVSWQGYEALSAWMVLGDLTKEEAELLKHMDEFRSIVSSLELK